MCLNRLKVLVAAYDVLNPLAISWVHGFKSLGYDVSVVVTNESTLTREKLTAIGFYNDEFPRIPIFQHKSTDETRRGVHASLGQDPDIIFFWEGNGILRDARRITDIFPSSKAIFCVMAYPNCASHLRKMSIDWHYRKLSDSVGGYVFFSKEQKEFFFKNIPNAKDKPSLVIIDPFFEKAFASIDDQNSDVPVLKRYDTKPHIIFTGNARSLWSRSLGHKTRDALGPFIASLCQRDVHVFVDNGADTRDLPNLHVFPAFRKPDLLEGKFSKYISQFDAHLVMYNEKNPLIKRRASLDLGTRLAYGLTATSPIAVTENSKFVKELWEDEPFGFTFHSVEDLALSLHDADKLKRLRLNMEKTHRKFSFESQADSLSSFVRETVSL